VKVDWTSVLVTATDHIVRRGMIPAHIGSGVLWSEDPNDVRELSALGVLAWEDREGRPNDPRYEWVGFNLLCNAAPTPFILDGGSFLTIDSFYESLKLPEGTRQRAECGVAPALEARRIARRLHDDSFVHRGTRILVDSAEHEGLVAAAISSKIAQNAEVESALRNTGHARLMFPLTYSRHPGLLARVTPLVLMIERWKRFHAQIHDERSTS
jgi:hypothetical protein